MLDMGCGSGILALAWLENTSRPALGVDNDVPFRSASPKTMRKPMGCRRIFELPQGKDMAGALYAGLAPYDLIMANIFARPLATMAKDLKRNLRPGGDCNSIRPPDASGQSGPCRPPDAKTVPGEMFSPRRLVRASAEKKWKILGTMINLKNHIRSLPDFPKPGITFYDIGTLLAHGPAWRETVARLDRS